MFPYLEAYLEVFTAELGGAATQLAVQTLVNRAAGELIGAVTTVVLAVTQQCLLDTVPVVTNIAFVLCWSGNLEKGGEREEQ